MSLTKKVYLTISGYDIKLSDNLTFYQKDQLKLIFYINEYGIDYENNATTRALMPVNPLNAILFIENPDGVDSVSSTRIEDNAVTFYLDSTHTQYVGVSRMQLRLFDQDGCAITLPHFTFEIRENIYGSGDVRFQNVVMVDQTGTVILTEDNDMLDVGDVLTMGTEVAYPQVTKTIKELPIKRNLDGTEKLIVEDNEATKQAPLTTIVDEIKQNSQEKIREIESELNQTNAQLSQLEIAFNNLGYINVKDYGVKGDGITDDTDNIQTLIDTLSNYHYDTDLLTTAKTVNPVRLYFPRGRYLLTKTIHIPPYLNIYGDYSAVGNNYFVPESGKGYVDFKKMGTVFVCNLPASNQIPASENNFAFNVSPFRTNGVRTSDITIEFDGPNSKDYERVEGVTFKDITIVTGNKRLFGGIALIGAPFTTLENVNIYGSDVALYLNSCWNVRVTNCALHGKNYGVFAWRHVNNCSFDGCSIEQYYMFGGGGSPDRYYTKENFPNLIGEEGDHMPSEYVQFTTGIYQFYALQMSFTNCTVQNWQRAYYSRMGNANLENIWFEANKKVIIHATHSSLNIDACRVEGNTPVFRITGTYKIVVNALSGGNEHGNFIKDVANLYDFKGTDAKSNIVIFGGANDENMNCTPINTNGIRFAGELTLSDMRVLTITPTNTSQQVVAYPSGYDRFSTVILSVNRYRNNNVTSCENNLEYSMSSNGITFTPQEANVSYQFLLAKLENKN